MKVRKTTNTFLIDLEKRNCKQGTITQLKVNTNNLICTVKEILKECKSFYQNLYSSKVTAENPEEAFFYPQQENEKVLNDGKQSLCKGELKENECLKTLKSIVSDKSVWSPLRILQSVLR